MYETLYEKFYFNYWFYFIFYRKYLFKRLLEIYSKRIKWLLQSSRKVFGLVEGERVAILIDSSNSNMSFGRAIELQDALIVNIFFNCKFFSYNFFKAVEILLSFS